MGTSTGGEWSQAESSIHINCGAFAVKTFTKGKARMTVFADGQCVRSTLHKQDGGYQIPSFSSAHNPCRGRISPRSTKCSGRQGVQSNVGSSRLEARPPGGFTINQLWGPLEVDLFASRLTTQLPRFYSLRPDPQTCIYPGL